MKYDPGHIINYILEYDIGVPPSLIICVCLFVFCIIGVLFSVRTSYSTFLRQASCCLLIGYVFLVFCTTIFFREETFEKHYKLHPLLSYTMLYDKLLAELIMNVMMFVPIGFFTGGALKKKHILNALIFGLGLSLFIELTQLITTRGVFNVDDIIHNTLGCIVGFGCFVFCYKLMKHIA